MQIKTNIRAGKGGASGTGQNSKNSGADNKTAEPVDVVPVPIVRCPGY